MRHIRFLEISMKFDLFLLIFSTLLLIPSLSNAECGTEHCVDVYIEQIYVRDTGKNLILTSGTESQLDCSGPGDWLEIADTENKKDLLSVLMAAMIAKKRTRIVVKGAGELCDIRHVEVNSE